MYFRNLISLAVILFNNISRTAQRAQKVDANILKLYDKIALFHKKKRRRAHFGHYMHEERQASATNTTAPHRDHAPTKQRTHLLICLFSTIFAKY